MTDEEHDRSSGSGGSDGEPVTWKELWVETTAVVGDRTQARWLCETAADAVRDDFLEVLDEAATRRMVSHLDAMIARLRAGEPLQYVLGRWGFRRLDLAVDARVLIPRPETELVAGVAIDLARSIAPTRTVIDLGTGSGAIGLSVADELPMTGTAVWLTDASAAALDVARANLAGVGSAAQNVRVAHGDWFDALPDGLVADVVVSNPPYVAAGAAALEAQVADWEPPEALVSGTDGLDDLRTIIAGAPGRLTAEGALVLEIGFDQGPAVSTLLASAGFAEVEIRPDLAGHDRIAIGRRPAGR